MKTILLILLLLILSSCHLDKVEVTAPPFDVNEITHCNIQTFSATEANFIVHEVNDFLKAISDAEPENTIYISDSSYLDFSDYELPVIISKSLNIVSGRNSDNSNGATLYANAPGKTLIKIEADNVTLQGLKIIGYDTEIGLEMYNPKVTNGIVIGNYNSLKIENCEISGWSHGGIYLYNSTGNIISRSYIHHNQRYGLGYGIVLYNKPYQPTNALISCNFFEYNRHDIAASGNEGQSYEASYNIIGLGSENHHRFDMHGKNGDTEKVAGTKIIIHHNYFLSDKGYAIFIRGISIELSEIYENTFAHPNAQTAIEQTVLREKIQYNNLLNINVRDNQFK
ncbi:right-handed parallel beta-helix repeat-containing protein [Salegentibacter sp. JZCK2]|uniref:right-handed parallel beta-helix repeat-containing protein n=1 Tax=Salegentibacter tibetensis TaxID=2873600 RepID=UPI001CCBE0A8|nr:right-handed parallel beta-helix repeat-containing protein [Salegentibacter tibetensis]MBZ9728698.1 right-handed parallel beta-helix repeat-containing protein [Salegentibacter tibetensis]